MHAVMLSQFGSPDVLVPHEIACPTPGRGQVLIRNEAVGVNFRDTWIRSGTVPPPPGTSIPLILGNEVGGTVTQVGEGAPLHLEGTRVVTSTGGSGGYAEYALARADDLVTVPSAVDVTDATAMFVQGRVALGAFRAARIAPGDRVLILGAAGGIGILLAQLSAGAGATTIIGANGTQTKASLARGFGATHAIEYREEAFSEQLHEIASEGIDVVFDGVGGDAAETAFEHLATGTGRHVVFGYSSGAPLHVETSTLIARGISVLGFGGQATLPSNRAALVQEGLELLASGALRPLIGQRYSLAEAGRAHRAIEERATTGKTLLFPGHDSGSRTEASR